MPSDTPSALATLRHQVRLLTVGVAALALALAGLTGWVLLHDPVPAILQVQRLDVVDAQGRQRVVLGVTQHNDVSILVNNRSGAQIVSAGGVTDGTGRLTLRDTTDQDRVQLGAAGHYGTGGAVVVLNTKGRVAIALTPDAGGNGLVQGCVDHAPQSICKSMWLGDVPVGR